MTRALMLAIVIAAWGLACEEGGGIEPRESGEDLAHNAVAVARLDVHVSLPDPHPVPPTAKLTVALDKVPAKLADTFRSDPEESDWRSRRLVKKVVARSVPVDPGSAQVVRLTYTPSELDMANLYVVRAFIKDAQQLIYTQSGSAVVFGGDHGHAPPTNGSVEVALERVEGKQP